MILAREWQDSGRAQQLDVGQDYDLPDVVGSALVAEGAAQRLDVGQADDPPEIVDSALVAEDSDEPRQVRPPETKPLAPPETKRSRKSP